MQVTRAVRLTIYLLKTVTIIHINQWAEADCKGWEIWVAMTSLTKKIKIKKVSIKSQNSFLANNYIGENKGRTQYQK